jgi:hypothetical protein
MLFGTSTLTTCPRDSSQVDGVMVGVTLDITLGRINPWVGSIFIDPGVDVEGDNAMGVLTGVEEGAIASASRIAHPLSKVKQTSHIQTQLNEN